MSTSSTINEPSSAPLWQRPNEIKFLLVFIICYSAFHSLYFLIPDNILRDVFHHYAILIFSVDVINYLAPHEMVTVVGNKLVSAKATLSVVRGCDGAGVSFLLVAAIMAFRARLSDKVIGILTGILLLYVINQVRIIGLYFVIAYNREWFVPIHTYFAPTLIVILSSAFFAWWAYKSTSAIDSNVNTETTSS